MDGPQPACSRDRSRGHSPVHDPGSRPAAFVHQYTMGEVSQAQPQSPHLDRETFSERGSSSSAWLPWLAGTPYFRF